MLVRRPNHYDPFRCIAGDCPDTCCAAWDIVIDEQSASFYRTLSDGLGERIRQAMTVDEEGEVYFSVAGGYCPLLTEKRLCAIQIELGEERVCQTCRSHPRFIEEYGFFREEALAASCPAAIELILGTDVGFITEKTDEPEFFCQDVDQELLVALLPCRDVAFALLKRSDLPWNARLASLVDLGLELQFALDEVGMAALSSVVAQWNQKKELEFSRRGSQTGRRARRRCVELLGELEVLDRAWKEETENALAVLEVAYHESGICEACWETYEIRWAAYLIWRWFLRADFDGDIYAKLVFPVLSILALRELALARWIKRGGRTDEDWMKLARRWAKEIEHSDENLVTLWAAVREDPDLAPAGLMEGVWSSYDWRRVPTDLS